MYVAFPAPKFPATTVTEASGTVVFYSSNVLGTSKTSS